MASGTINGGSFGGGYLYVNWNSTNNVAGNYSTVTFQVCLYRSSEWRVYVDKSANIRVNDRPFNFTTKVNGGAGHVQLYSDSTTIPHGADGKATINITAYLGCQLTWSGNWVEGISCSQNVDLGTIPRGTSIKSFAAKSNTWRSITFSFTAADSCSEVYIHKNGGARIVTGIPANSSSGTFTIFGLTPNTQYTWQLEVVRNGVSTTSTIGYATKLGVQSASLTSTSIMVESTIPLNIVNPDGAQTSLFMYLTCKNANGVSTLYADVVTKINAGKTNGAYTWTLTADEKNKIYETMKYSTEAVLVVYVQSLVPDETGFFDIKYTGAATYKIDSTACKPTLSTAAMTLDTTTTGIVGNSTYLIQGVSAISWSVAKSSAAAKNKATLKSLVFQYGTATQTYDLTTSTTTFSKTLNNLITTGSYTLKTYVVDSRGLISTDISKTYTVLSYKTPVLVPTVVRQLSSGGKIDVSFTAAYSRLIVSGADKNAVSYLKYGYKELGTEPTASTAITDYTSANAANGVDKTLTFNKLAYLSLDANKNYKFKFLLKDKINEYVVSVDVVDGNPLMRVLDTGQVGINCKPDTSKLDEKLRVGGSALIDKALTASTIKATGALEVGTTITSGTSITGQNLYAQSNVYENKVALSSKYASLSTFNTFQDQFNFETKTVVYNGYSIALLIFTFGKFCIINAGFSVQVNVGTAWGGIAASGTIDCAYPYPYEFNGVPGTMVTYGPVQFNAWAMVVDRGSEKNAAKIQILRGSSNDVNGAIHLTTIGKLK